MLLYECLGVSPYATQRDIAAAYEQKLASLQNGGGFRSMLSKLLHFAYPYEYAFRVLGDVQTRQEYDRNPHAFDAVTWQYWGF